MSEIKELSDFLNNFKVAEKLSLSLIKKINVDTALTKNLKAAIEEGCDIFLTGSAGSGKTHLFESIKTELNKKYDIVHKPPKNKQKRKFILWIRDATPLTVKQRKKLLSMKHSNKQATVIAINEGPLKDNKEVEETKGGKFTDAFDLLRISQSARDSEDYDSAKPTVFNLGSYDPVADGVLEKILGLKILSQVVAKVECSCPKGDCYRKFFWRQLYNEKKPEETLVARKKFSEAVMLANFDRGSWSFRDIWGLISDLVFGGECTQTRLPKTPWFYRLFFGRSKISKSICEILDPLSIPLPNIDSRLWFGDLNQISKEEKEFRHVSAQGKNEKQFLFNLLKLQYLMISPKENVKGYVNKRYDENLIRDVFDGQKQVLIKCINDYMTYSLVTDPSGNKLDLWIEHDVERRKNRSPGQCCLMRIRSEDFEIRQVRAIINAPVKNEIYGSQRFLIHKKTNIPMGLRLENLRLLEQGRSYRRTDRPGSDLEWDLFTFFKRILHANKHQERLFEIKITTNVLKDNRHITKKYNVNVNPLKISTA